MVDIVAETGDKESEDLKITQDTGETTTVLKKSVAEVSHGEGMGPVVIGRIPITFLHHQYEPVQSEQAIKITSCFIKFSTIMLWHEGCPSLFSTQYWNRHRDEYKSINGIDL